MRRAKHGHKRAVPRHRVLSAGGAAALERAIERTERQAGEQEIERDRQLLAEAEALDRQYAEADAFDSAHTPPEDEEQFDEYTEQRKAGLSQGQP